MSSAPLWFVNQDNLFLGKRQEARGKRQEARGKRQIIYFLNTIANFPKYV
ncbi:hypothetical protein [Aphanizomenon flos-aquae]|nr:hypothetical protein [Aphanizomenon flos-aquae]